MGDASALIESEDEAADLSMEKVLTLELLLEVTSVLSCEVGLVGIASSCHAFYSLLSEGSPSLLEQRFAELSVVRGWRAECPTPHVPMKLLPDGWAVPSCQLRYIRRVRSLPPPHAPWKLGSGRTLTVGEGKRFTTVREAVAAARDGDTLLLPAGLFDEGHQPLVLKR